MEKKISISQIKEVAQEAYNEVKGSTGGKNADYIPYLANIDSKLFGLSICLMNGQTINIGDTDYRFGIESVSKVHTAILILRQYGAQKVLDMIGADATGLPFNSIIAILLENDHPSTPLVNAGAISACSMVQPVGNSDKKWDAIVQNVTELCGSAPQLIDELYKSETATNFNNRSIAWLLKNYNRIYDNPDMALDLYTRQCSLGITAPATGHCRRTIANNGVNPVTKQTVFEASLAPKTHVDDFYRRLLRAFRRLDVHCRHTRQERCRRWRNGRTARCDGCFRFRSPVGRSRQLRQGATGYQVHHEQARPGCVQR